MHEAPGAEPAPGMAPKTLLREQVNALYEQAPLGVVVALGVGGMFVYVFHRVVAPSLVWGWYAAIIAGQAVSLVQWRRFRLAPLVDNWEPKPWLVGYVLRVLAAGLLLGSMPWIFFLPHYGDARWLTILTICSLAAGSITSYAYHPPTMLLFLITLTAPTAVRLLGLPGQSGGIGGSIFVFYIGMLAWFGRNQASMLRKSIEMRYANTHLLEQLRERTLELEASHRAKSRFFAAASHDLRQPLHALGYYSSLLQPASHDVTNVQRIEQCVGALDALLEGVLDIARLEAGTVKPRRTPVDLATQFRRLIALYGGAASAKGLQLRLRLPAAGAWGNTDEQMLERILANLVNNAIRYTHRGGLLLGVRRAGSHWRVAVIDSGIGIADESQQDVFNEFVQLHNHERDASQGVGLGLATVKRLCDLLAHPISVRSSPGRGSRFELRVPVCDVAPASETEAPDKCDDRLEGHVLLVEDNELVADSLARVLHEWGLSCEVASDGAQALAFAAARRFDAAVSDWRLPGVADGCLVLHEIGMLQPWLRLRVLMTGERDDRIGNLPPQVLLLRKPVRPIRLRALLTAHLQPAMMPAN